MGTAARLCRLRASLMTRFGGQRTACPTNACRWVGRVTPCAPFIASVRSPEDALR